MAVRAVKSFAPRGEGERTSQNVSLLHATGGTANTNFTGHVLFHIKHLNDLINKKIAITTLNSNVSITE